MVISGCSIRCRTKRIRKPRKTRRNERPVLRAAKMRLKSRILRMGKKTRAKNQRSLEETRKPRKRKRKRHRKRLLNSKRRMPKRNSCKEQIRPASPLYSAVLVSINFDFNIRSASMQMPGNQPSKCEDQRLEVDAKQLDTRVTWRTKKRQLFFCTLRGEKYRKAIEEDVTDKIGQVTSMRDALRACLDNVKAHMSIYHR